MLKAATILLVVASLALAGCGKDKDKDKTEPKGKEAPAKVDTDKAAPDPKPAAAPAADGRRVAIEVKNAGYLPDRVEAAPGEKLVLVFQRTEDTGCGKFVKVGEGAEPVELPLGEPVEIAFTMPASGEAPFMCGMDMMKGVLAVVEE